MDSYYVALETNSLIPEPDKHDNPTYDAFVDWLHPDTFETDPDDTSILQDLATYITDPSILQITVSHMWQAFQAGSEFIDND